MCPQVKTYLGMQAIFSSPAMQELIDLVQRIAQTNAAVLITGESGCGKELIARAVHHYSLRCTRPWVDVSCAALPEHLVESELFGYEKGAFSGADSPKPGLFELANHGTLFLDEVGELEPRMQVKLLRVLDGVAYYRLGGTRKVTVDVRVVGATNQDLENMVDGGQFRGDLYHRLGQICLRVPPLRERREDIVPLAEHFLKQANPRMIFSGEALRTLEEHSWPGNVRELRNAVTKATVLARTLEIRSGDLMLSQPRAVSVAGRAIAMPPANLDGMEKTTILRVLAETNGHQQKAAELLGISRRTLSRKLKLYGREAVRQSCAS
jgi:DNA-binding NtrC family response regulator